VQILFFITFLTLGSIGHAQVSFYIRPALSSKTNYTHFYEYFMNGSVKDRRNTRTNEYFTFINHGRYFNIWEWNWGIHVGVSLKDKHSIELGYSTDNIALAMGIAMDRKQVNKETNVQYGYESTNFLSLSTDPSGMRRISATYSYKVLQNKNKTIQLRTIIGLGVLQTVGADIFDPVIQAMYYDLPDPKELLADETYVYPISDISNQRIEFSTYANFGLGLDFVSKKKQRNLFSLEVFYLHSRRIIYSHYFRYRVVDKLVSTDYIYSLHSRGSGFYFNLSKKIQLYPWIWGKNRKSIDQ